MSGDYAISCAVDEDCSGILCGADAETSNPVCTSGECQCVNRANFFYVLGMYQCFIMAIAMYAYLKNKNSLGKKKEHAMGGEEGDMSKQEVKNMEMQEHFMASGSYGTVVMALTTFSTIFSGYIIVGVPDEMALFGYISFRWLMMSTFAIASWLLLQTQLRNVGFKRNYASPSDIISDRFNSKALTAAAAIIWVAQLFITITGQMYALHSIIQGLSLGQLNAKALTWGICFIILFCETVGGQRSVSLSDAIQAAIMLTTFFILPFVLVYHYGGLADMVDYDCKGKVDNGDGTIGGCLAYTRPWAVLHPTASQFCNLEDGYNDTNCIQSHFEPGAFANGRTWNSSLNMTESVDMMPMLQSAALNQVNFAMFNGGTFGLQPFVLQKVFVAQSDDVLRKANMFMYAANFLAIVPMVFVGLVYSAKLPAGASAFPAVAGALMNKGGFSEFIAIMASCSAFAALMSTVDSMLISANNVFTVDVLKNWLMIDSSARSLKIVSLIISPLILFGATAWTLFDYDKIDLAYLITMGSSMVWQIAPVLLSSFYTDRITAYAYLAGIIVGFIISIIFAQERKEPSIVTGLALELSGWFGVLANAATVLITQAIFTSVGKPWMISDGDRDFDTHHPVVRKQYGTERLTAKLINEHYLKDTVLPYASTFNKVLGFAVVVVTTLTCPWWGSPYEDQGVVGGFTKWALVQFIVYACCVVSQIYIVWSWKTSDDDLKVEDARLGVVRKPAADDSAGDSTTIAESGTSVTPPGTPEPAKKELPTPPGTPEPVKKSSTPEPIKKHSSSNKVAPLDIDIRGKCAKCGKNVLATQPRTQVDGVYSHDVCPE